MRLYKHLVSICCFLVLFNCNKEQKIGFSDINITADNNTIVDVNIPEAHGDKTVSNQINSEIQKAIISALHIGNPDEISLKDFADEIIKLTGTNQKVVYHPLPINDPST